MSDPSDPASPPPAPVVRIAGPVGDTEQMLADGLASAPPPICAPAECRHESFAAVVAVNRFEDTGRFLAEIRIVCIQCREPFRAIGVPPGIAWDGPACSIDGLELRIPVEPEIEKRLFGGAAFQMPPPPATRQ